MSKQYIYSLNYQFNERDLCALEMKYLFNSNFHEKIVFSNKKIEPSLSPFIKKRLEVIYKVKSFNEIIEHLEKSPILINDFKVKYLKLSDNDTHFKNRRSICKEVGLRFKGMPCFTDPKTTYGISFYEENWYFGEMVENNGSWIKHKEKPCSYSSSLPVRVAKVIINLASDGDVTKRLVDPCCGVGTVLLEGFLGGYNIKGWEINNKVSENAKENLSYYNYDVEVTCGDIKDINEFFDASIVDLPYGMVCKKSEESQLNIIENAKRISKRVILISSVDICKTICDINLKVIDYCAVANDRKGGFSRHIWVCE